MIDIHCHLLPGIDDGAPSADVSMAMLAMQRKLGVERMFLTPHFYPEDMAQEDFLAARAASWEAFSAGLEESDKDRIRLGAEVRYCPQLLRLDLQQLTLADTSYLLLELPSRQYPPYLVQSVEQLLGRGVLPILAHVERCLYFRKEPALLKRLVDLGALAQVSAASLFDRRDKNFAKACLDHQLVQMVASDAHDASRRPPNLDQCSRLGEDSRQLHEAVTEAVWDNELPNYFRPTLVKKTIFGYR